MRKGRALQDLAFTPEWERNPGGSWVQRSHLTSKRITLAAVWGTGYIEAKQKQKTSGDHGPSPRKRWWWPKPGWDSEQSLHAGCILKVESTGFTDGWDTEGMSLLLHSFNHSYIPRAQTEFTVWQVLCWVSNDSKASGTGTSLVVQWLILCASSAGDTSSIPGWGTKVLSSHGVQPKKKTLKHEHHYLLPLRN